MSNDNHHATFDGYEYLRKYYSLMGRDLNTLTMPLYDNTLSDYKNRYSKRMSSFKDIIGDIDDEIEKFDNINLWIIDMQKDFIDESFNDVSLKGKGKENNFILENIPPGIYNDAEGTMPFGRFAVKEGSKCVDDVIYYLDKMLNKVKNTTNKNVNLIFSRDVHTNNKEDVNHCSFRASSGETFNGLGFPAHCVNGTAGCQLHNKIKDWLENLTSDTMDNLDYMVTYKGFNKDIESFGAYPYICKSENDNKYFLDRYVESRQHNSCSSKCNSNTKIINDTGSFVIINKENNSILRDKDYEEYIDFNNKNVSFKNIKTYLEDNLKNNNLDKSKILNLVCGLAGDYCVRDTAFNLIADGYTNTYVIADATRYAILNYDQAIKHWFPKDDDNVNKINNLHQLIKKYQMNPIEMNEINKGVEYAGKVENGLLKTAKISELSESINYEFFLTPTSNVLFSFSFNPLTEKKVFLMDKERQKNLFDNIDGNNTTGGRRNRRRTKKCKKQRQRRKIRFVTKRRR